MNFFGGLSAWRGPSQRAVGDVNVHLRGELEPGDHALRNDEPIKQTRAT